MTTPEECARETIGKKLRQSDWTPHSRDERTAAAERTTNRVNVSPTSCNAKFDRALDLGVRGVLVSWRELKGLGSDV